ncbi:MAG: glutamine amidotransferase [Rhodanobacteraceae bacterium]|nr:MAG: glutamine amidotransferase [Rhodanobacteraceae bacterium]
MKRPLLLIQTGEAPEPIAARFGRFADWFRRAMRLDAAEFKVVRVDAGAPLPAHASVAGAVISGSGAMVTERADWSERTARWIREAAGLQTPVYGVCYGHQLMAHALGGTVGWLAGGREIGTQVITRDAASRADGLGPLPATFPAQTTHRQSVLQPPAAAEVLASSRRDPYQLLRYGPQLLSSQFHPEFTADIMRAYISARAGALRTEGLDPDALEQDVEATEAARGLLERFARRALAAAESRQ